MCGEIMFSRQCHQTRCVWLTVLFLLLGSGVVFGVFVFQHWQVAQSRQNLHATALTTAREIPAFSMLGVDAQSFTKEQLKGQWTWIFFGFTQCPQLCPMTMSKLAKAYHKLQQDGVETLPRVVMITLDPERDSLSRLKEYVHAFEPAFYGARGDEPTVQALAAQLGIAYARVQSSRTKQKQAYNIEHSGAVLVINPEGKLQAFFNPPYTVNQLVHDHHIFIRN
jgi:protein SCO1